MSSKIYTRTGDKGKTTLIGGSKVPKNHLRIESYGTIDELNSWVGLLKDYVSDIPLIVAALVEIQDRLFTIGSALACDPDKEPKMKLPDLLPQDVQGLEEQMDSMNSELPEMKSFILPGGHVFVSTAHICRCVCRRAERLCVAMQENQLFIDPIILQYLNRLSDYFFVLARFLARRMQAAETVWKPRV